MRQLLQW